MNPYGFRGRKETFEEEEAARKSRATLKWLHLRIVYRNGRRIVGIMPTLEFD